jgi:CubicO group peptidase (beta-lactamase class C family)
MLLFMRFRLSLAKLGVVLFAFLGGVFAAAQADDAGLTKEDIAALINAGEAQASPLFQTQAQRRVVFANTDYFAPTNRLPASPNPYPLVSAPQDLTSVSYLIDSQQHLFSDLLASDALMGMAVVQDNRILFEHYAEDHSPESRWISFSVTKSISSLLIGAAVQDGYIRSAQDKVSDYLPRLEGSAYGESTIEDLLHMASGIAWNEDYEDPNSDVSIAGALNGIALTNHLAKLPREAPSGKLFNYNTGEANLVGEVLRAAIGSNAAPYLSTKVWQPFGMEHDATWLLDAPYGRETGGCCISASVRDYARLGLFALNDGVLPSGERVLPEGWMAASTTPFADESEYGYMWWLLGEGRYTASGIFGQKIVVVPDKRLVIAVHSNAVSAVGSGYARHLNAALKALVTAVPAP